MAGWDSALQRGSQFRPVGKGSCAPRGGSFLSGGAVGVRTLATLRIASYRFGTCPSTPQAVDIVHPWTLGADGQPLAPFTTFSICMIQRQSSGKLPLFAEGLRAYKALKPGDRVLIAEACNHNRITDICNDIGMVQASAWCMVQGFKQKKRVQAGALRCRAVLPSVLLSFLLTPG